MKDFLKFIFAMYRISRLERKQARPLREIINATASNKPLPEVAKNKLLALDEEIRKLRESLKHD